MHCLVALVVCAATLPHAAAFYLPGVAPHQYEDGE
eukprot:COSAG01_NODE_23989_length_794_cov_4.395683_1_plen_34_part_01